MRTVFYILLSVSGYANAMDIVWLKLSGNYRYTSGDISCTGNTATTTAYLSVELREGQVVAAGLSEYIRPPKFWLNKAELNGIALSTDEAGRYWLDSLTLNERVLNRFVRQYHSYRACASVVIKETNEPIRFEFEKEGIPIGVLASHSQNLKLTGANEDGASFAIEFKVVQHQWRNYE